MFNWLAVEYLLEAFKLLSLLTHNSSSQRGVSSRSRMIDSASVGDVFEVDFGIFSVVHTRIEKVELKFHLMASASSQSARRGSFQSSRDAASQPSKVGRHKWTIFEVGKLVEAMREMVDAGVYKADNGFKPGYLHFLEEKMRASCPSSGFKAKPHIESRVKTLKKDWTTVHDILTGVRHGCSGFGYDNGTNTIVASDDVWVDYIKNFPEAEKWCGKRFYYCDECCYIFGNDRATGEEAHSAADYLNPTNEFVADLSDSESGGPNTVNIVDSSGTRLVRSETPEATKVMAVEIGKSTIEIAKAILDDKDRREAVVAALEEVYGIPPIKRAIYATKLAKGIELMVGFLSLDPHTV
ncbi:hypothetical protein Sjap_015387 [Stephania japonica]|uniref:Myb/SANT-like domain-containing protein n=1 Tax=Stephania japonica TaxID=461633 RepID=A0AAP0NST9_9MAGN